MPKLIDIVFVQQMNIDKSIVSVVKTTHKKRVTFDDNLKLADVQINACHSKSSELHFDMVQLTFRTDTCMCTKNALSHSLSHGGLQIFVYMSRTINMITSA